MEESISVKHQLHQRLAHQRIVSRRELCRQCPVSHYRRSAASVVGATSLSASRDWGRGARQPAVLGRSVGGVDSESEHTRASVADIARGDEEVIALVVGAEGELETDGGGAAAGCGSSDDGVVALIEAVGSIIEVLSGRALDADSLLEGSPIQLILCVAAITFEVGSFGAAVGEALVSDDVASVHSAWARDETEELLVVSNEFAVGRSEL